MGYEEDVRAAMAYVFGTTIVCDTMENAKKASITVCIEDHERVLLAKLKISEWLGSISLKTTLANSFDSCICPIVNN